MALDQFLLVVVLLLSSLQQPLGWIIDSGELLQLTAGFLFAALHLSLLAMDPSLSDQILLLQSLELDHQAAGFPFAALQLSLLAMGPSLSDQNLLS